MPDRADHNPDGWTFQTLYIHLMEITRAAKQGVDTAMASAEKAILKAETATEKRFDSVNEFRQAMKDQQETFANKAETNLRLDDLADRLDRITSRVETSSGKSSGVVMMVLGGAWIATTGIALLAIFVRH